jgi:hypothetical protein
VNANQQATVMEDIDTRFSEDQGTRERGIKGMVLSSVRGKRKRRSLWGGSGSTRSRPFASMIGLRRWARDA